MDFIYPYIPHFVEIIRNSSELITASVEDIISLYVGKESSNDEMVNFANFRIFARDQLLQYTFRISRLLAYTCCCT